MHPAGKETQTQHAIGLAAQSSVHRSIQLLGLGGLRVWPQPQVPIVTAPYPGTESAVPIGHSGWEYVLQPLH